jgi:hypothetical protein
MRYLAYGSNMLTQRLRARVSSASNPTRIALHGYQLRFNKRSDDCSGKCNILETGLASDVVHGVLYDVDKAQLPLLDEAEGCGHGYHRDDKVPVRIPGSDTLIVTVYAADSNAVDDALIPYRWYWDLVIAGAEQHQLPQDYIAGIRAVPYTADPMPNRKSKREAETVLKEFALCISKDLPA